jgi:hypothetical protein
MDGDVNNIGRIVPGPIVRGSNVTVRSVRGHVTLVPRRPRLGKHIYI